MAFKAPRTFDQKPPVGYVAGLGRGAVGFVTRSDIGTAQMPAKDAAPLAAAPSKEKEADYSESNYDEFGGYGNEKLFEQTPYDEDDKDADKIYSEIDDRMDGRRKRQREDKESENLKKLRLDRPSIAAQLAPFKAELASVSANEWLAIPETGDHSLKFKKSKNEKQGDYYTPMTDAMIRDSHASVVNNVGTSLMGGFATPMSGTSSSLVGLAGARGTVLQLKLDKMGDSVTGQTVIDPKGYLTDLNSVKGMNDSDISDYKKARQLLKSVIETNPTVHGGWVALARLEQRQGKLVAARKVIKDACEACPNEEDVWLEAIKYQTPENNRVILADGARHNPHSVKIWLAAAELETDISKKKRVLRRGLEFNDTSVALWKAAVELESPEDARILLSRAVECVPSSVDMWLALTKLESYENAQKVLNEAAKAIPTDAQIWITAAQLEEAHGNVHKIEEVISTAVKTLISLRALMGRATWIKLAHQVEDSGAPLTCGAIIRNTIGNDVDEMGRLRTWEADAENSEKSGHPKTAQAIYAHALTIFPQKESLWDAAYQLEKNTGTPDDVEALLKQAVKRVPTSVKLWLYAAKHKWNEQKDVAGARGILREAFVVNEKDEAFQKNDLIWLAAVKLEQESGEDARARALLAKARKNCSNSERVWLKSALHEWQVGDEDAERKLLDEALEKFPLFDKFWMMMGQLCQDKGETDNARLFYKKGIKCCPGSIPLWLLASKLEEVSVGVSKARTVLEMARLKNPQSDIIWRESVRLEFRNGDEKQAENIMAKALQACPKSGILYCEAIEISPRPMKRAKSRDALRACGNDDYYLNVKIAELFAIERKKDKAQRWFERAVALNPKNGDGWAYYYKNELTFGDAAEAEKILINCEKANNGAGPTHGEMWAPRAKSKEGRKLDKKTICKLIAAEIDLTK